MAIRLSVRAPGGGEATDLDFDQARVRIGRGALCDVRLPDPAVSAVHAMVLLDRDRYYVVDVGSTNGTTLGGEPLVANRRKLLRSGDVIGVGAPGGFEILFRAGVAMLSPHSQERTVAAARQLARHVLSSGGLALREPALVVLSGPQEGERFPIPAGPATLTIGRSEDCDITLVDGEVSRRHAELVVGVDGVTVRDMGGKNTLRLGDREVSRARLHDRDELCLGSTVLVFDEPLEAFLREVAERPESETESPRDRASGPPPGEAVDATEGEGGADAGATSEGPSSGSSSVATARERPDARAASRDEERQPSPSTSDEPTDPPGTDGTAASPRAEKTGPGSAPPRAAPRPRWGTAGSEVAVLLVGALALAACVAALVWLFR